jgi:hypothetical protein
MANEKIEPVTPAPEEDPHADLTKYRLDQSFIESVGVKKVLTTVPVRKPKAQDFIRVHPSEHFRQPFAVIELKDDREHYLITPPIAAAIPAEIVTITLYTTINRQQTISLWPVRLPSSDGRQNEWHRTAQVAAERAMVKWIRVTSNMSLGAYEITEASDKVKIPEPEWPQEYSFNDLLKIGFRDRIIDGFDHPVLKRLRGEC